MYTIDHGVTDCIPMIFATLEHVAGPVLLDLFQGKSSGRGPVASRETSAAEVGDVNRNMYA